MADYVSNYSGDQIDEAVSRALPGGALDTGKVSVGFGYGGTMPVIAIPTNDDTDGTKFDEKLNAFLNDMGNSSVKQIIFEDYPYLSSGRFVGTLYKNNANFAVLYGAGYGANDNIVVKKLISGVWKPFEWVNPPMQLGKEYRTTERYQGKPVYRKMIQYTQSSASPETGSISIPHGISNFDGMVSISAKAGIYPLPYVGSSGGVTGVGAPNATSVGINTYKTSWSTAYAFTLDMRYTKTTD